jgi:hypothetical protein
MVLYVFPTRNRRDCSRLTTIVTITLRKTTCGIYFVLFNRGGPSWGRMACHHNNEGKPCLEGPFHQPCFLEWGCCPVGSGVRNYNATASAVTCNTTRAKLCKNACAAAASTPEFMVGPKPLSASDYDNSLD